MSNRKIKYKEKIDKNYKTNFYRRVAKKIGCTGKDVKLFYDAIFEEIHSELLKMGRFQTNLGTFRILMHRGGNKHHIHTDEIYIIPPFLRLKFVISKALKNDIKNLQVSKFINENYYNESSYIEEE